MKQLANQNLIRATVMSGLGAGIVIFFKIWPNASKVTGVCVCGGEGSLRTTISYSAKVCSLVALLNTYEYTRKVLSQSENIFPRG